MFILSKLSFSEKKKKPIIETPLQNLVFAQQTHIESQV